MAGLIKGGGMPPEDNQEIEFGWLPEMFECTTNLVNISMLDSYDRAVQKVKDYEETGTHWTYPPYVDSATEKCRKPSLSFVLPSTHRMVFLMSFAMIHVPSSTLRYWGIVMDCV